jgi:hypothetical protein
VPYSRRAARIGNRTTVAGRVVSEGDSISQAGSGGYNSLYATNHPDLDWHQTAVGGSSIATGSIKLTDRLQSDLGWNAEVVSVFIGANDLADTANYAATTDFLHALWRYIAPFRNAGAKVVVCTILPKGTAYSDAATHNATPPGSQPGHPRWLRRRALSTAWSTSTRRSWALDATANDTTYYNADALASDRHWSRNHAASLRRRDEPAARAITAGRPATSVHEARRMVEPPRPYGSLFKDTAGHNARHSR